MFFGTSSWKYPGWVGSIYSQERYLTRNKFSNVRVFVMPLGMFPEPQQDLIDGFDLARLRAARVVGARHGRDGHFGDDPGVFTSGIGRAVLAKVDIVAVTIRRSDSDNCLAARLVEAVER